MAFPKRLLADHEELVLDLRPHWVALVWPALQVVVLVAATSAAIAYVPDAWPSWVRWSLFALAVVLFLAFPMRAFVAWVTSHFVVTTDRVIHRSGWLARQSMEMPLERINDVRFKQGILERIIGAGDVIIESAGEYGQNRFTDVRRPESVQKTIYEASERNEQRMEQARWRAHGYGIATERLEPELRTTEDVPTWGEERPSIVEQLERLADLRDRGVINEAEFQEEKARILDDAR